MPWIQDENRHRARGNGKMAIDPTMTLPATAFEPRPNESLADYLMRRDLIARRRRLADAIVNFTPTVEQFPDCFVPARGKR